MQHRTAIEKYHKKSCSSGAAAWSYGRDVFHPIRYFYVLHFTAEPSPLLADQISSHHTEKLLAKCVVNANGSTHRTRVSQRCAHKFDEDIRKGHSVTKRCLPNAEKSISENNNFFEQQMIGERLPPILHVNVLPIAQVIIFALKSYYFVCGHWALITS